MTRETSIDVYRQIEAEGLLSKMNFEVYSTVFHHGPMTSGEAFYEMNRGRPMKALTQTRARFTDLRNAGALKELGTRSCKITGRTAIVWDVTARIPDMAAIRGLQPKKKMIETEKYQAMVNELSFLRIENTTLRRQLVSTRAENIRLRGRIGRQEPVEYKPDAGDERDQLSLFQGAEA